MIRKVIHLLAVAACLLVLLEVTEATNCPQGWCYSQGIFCGYNVCPNVQGFKSLYYCKGYGWQPKLVDVCTMACVDSRKGQDSCYPI